MAMISAELLLSPFNDDAETTVSKYQAEVSSAFETQLSNQQTVLDALGTGTTETEQAQISAIQQGFAIQNYLYLSAMNDPSPANLQALNEAYANTVLADVMRTSTLPEAEATEETTE